jgi:hypothetical protein
MYLPWKNVKRKERAGAASLFVYIRRMADKRI